MTTQEFSNAFDTLLSSYNHKAEFGDQSSYADVTLDEYEKSVFLTQAQDNIVKSYFDPRANSIGEGFDDTIRRQADFSSLITIAQPSVISSSGSTWNTGSTMFQGTTNTLKGTGDSYSGFKLTIYFGSNEDVAPSYAKESGVCAITMKVKADTTPKTYFSTYVIEDVEGITFQNTDSSTDNYLGVMTLDTAITSGSIVLTSYPTGSASAYDARGVLYNLPSNILLMLNERMTSTNGRFFTVVPISYKEYDRQMSRAYSQPLKKQCWRLFEGQSSTVTVSEVIPIEGVTISTYKIRYLRRPNPIILVDLGFSSSQEALQIDGYTSVTECELSPILHMDILEEAVRLALNSKGIETNDQKAARQSQKNNS